MKRLPIGIDDFEEIINENYYYIDKSLLIKEIISLEASPVVGCFNLKTAIKMLRKCKILIQNDLLNCLTYSGVGGQFSKSLWINRLRLRSILIAVLRIIGY